MSWKKKNNHIFAEEIYAVDHPWYDKGYIQENVKKIPKWVIKKNREFFLDNSKQKFKNKIFIIIILAKFIIISTMILHSTLNYGARIKFYWTIKKWEGKKKGK